MNKVIVIIIAIVIIAGGGFLVANRKSNNPTTNSTGSTSQPSTQVPASTNASAAATITYSDSGFSPSSITVKSGDTVAIKNTSGSTIQMDSNPHPLHTDDTDLNVGTVNAGQTVTFTVTKKGTFGYHNHLNPTQTATITIQ